MCSVLQATKTFGPKTAAKQLAVIYPRKRMIFVVSSKQEEILKEKEMYLHLAKPTTTTSLK
jgi:hypothetical protein